MEITLTKRKKFKLRPCGKFVAKWNQPKKDTPNALYVGSITFEHDSAMPVTVAQNKKIVGIMKRFKTDVLFNDYDNGFYTITSSGLTEINHEKLRKYRNDPAFKEAVDNGRSF